MADMTYAFDPELAVVVPHIPHTCLDDVAAARAWYDSITSGAAADLTGLDVTDETIPGYEGSPDVTVRVFRPSGATAPMPALLYMHGGGFVIGSVAAESRGCADLARTLGAVVVSVEYRLAPEHPFPAALHDCYAALLWLGANVQAVGVDPERIALYGQSAGAGIAAGLALFSRDNGGPALCFQFLGIPELDDRLETPSMTAFVDTPMWHRGNAVLSWQYYLGTPTPVEVSPYAAPSRATDLAGLPSAYVSTMQFDPLRDEGIAYASAMLAAGVQVELHSYPGTFHGSAMVPTAAVSQRVAAEQRDVLRRALGIVG